MSDMDITCTSCGVIGGFSYEKVKDTQARVLHKCICGGCGKSTFLRHTDKSEKDPGMFVMPFGKYKGEYLGDIPVDYLEWLHGQDFVKGKLLENIQALI